MVGGVAGTTREGLVVGGVAGTTREGLVVGGVAGTTSLHELDEVAEGGGPVVGGAVACPGGD